MGCRVGRPGGFHRQMRCTWNSLLDGKSCIAAQQSLTRQDSPQSFNRRFPNAQSALLLGGDRLDIVTVEGVSPTVFGAPRTRLMRRPKGIAALNTPVASPTGSLPNSSDFRVLTAAESSEMLGKILDAAGLKIIGLTHLKETAVGSHLLWQMAHSGGLVQCSGPELTQTPIPLLSSASSRATARAISCWQHRSSVDGSVVRIVTTTCRQGDNAVVTETAIICHGNGL